MTRIGPDDTDATEGLTMARAYIRVFTNTRRLCALVGVFALLSLLPRVGEAGLQTSPFNPSDNTGADSAWSNPAGMTGLQSVTSSAGVGVLFPVWKFETEVNEAGGDDGGNSGVNSVLPTFNVVVPVSDKVRLGVSIFAPLVFSGDAKVDQVL